MYTEIKSYQYVIALLKNCSPISGKLWYTNHTELESVREADAMAIAMDNATALPVALRYSN